VVQGDAYRLRRLLETYVRTPAAAIVSGLPLAVARALARVGADVADLAGPGFRDATRLAQTSPELADAILDGNAAEVRAALSKLRVALDLVERGLGQS